MENKWVSMRSAYSSRFVLSSCFAPRGGINRSFENRPPLTRKAGFIDKRKDLFQSKLRSTALAVISEELNLRNIPAAIPLGQNDTVIDGPVDGIRNIRI